MADGTLLVTPGVGTSLKVSGVDSGANVVQYVREIQPDTAAAPATWTLSTTANTTLIAVDAQRLGILMVNNGTGRVYLRFDTTAPSASSFHWFLEPGDRWEVPAEFCRLAMSSIAVSGAAGTLLWLLATKV